ncbi:MAG TPA: diguanylate cyclase [Desulfuromonadales bacterium]|nr:diguanylate cyclase [Desulfuromonadales bacterium]
MEPSCLIADDSKSARSQIINILKGATPFKTFLEAGNGNEAFKMLLDASVDVIICDLEMPELDGLKFLKLISTREELRNIPVVVVTVNDDLETKIKGLEYGASDYVTKPFNPEELVARVKVQHKIKSLQDHLKKNNELLLNLSNIDPLTQLFNRRYFLETLEKELMRSSRANTSFSLLMLDIDHFKQINDTYGHQAGDRALEEVAKLLRQHLRQYDIAARFGGDEFALVLPHTKLPQALDVAERLRAAVETLSFPDGLRMTASLGAACFPETNITAIDELIREADVALYNAKRAGRNRVGAMNA